MSNKKIVLYGAGANASLSIKHVKRRGYTPVCFVDSDERKSGLFIEGLQVRMFQEVVDEFGLENMLLFVTPSYSAKFEIMDFLIKTHKVAEEQIINYERYEWKKLCKNLADSTLILETGQINFCCNVNPKVVAPQIDYKRSTPGEVYRKFYQVREEVIESINHSGELCANCDSIIEGLFSIDNVPHIRAVGFGAGASCNFRCIYCGFTQANSHNQIGKDEAHDSIEKLHAVVDEFRKNSKIDTYTQVSIANGEPVLSPDFIKIMDMFYDNETSILTNASILSPAVCDKLRRGDSKLLISLDSGIAETFKVVKGVDCFDKVIANIIEYANHGEINLKYILMPNINTDDADIEGFLSIADKVKALVIFSRDLRGEEAYHKHIDVIKSALKKLIVGAQKRGLSYQVNGFESLLESGMLK